MRGHVRRNYFQQASMFPSSALHQAPNMAATNEQSELYLSTATDDAVCIATVPNNGNVTSCLLCTADDKLTKKTEAKRFGTKCTWAINLVPCLCQCSLASHPLSIQAARDLHSNIVHHVKALHPPPKKTVFPALYDEQKGLNMVNLFMANLNRSCRWS